MAHCGNKPGMCGKRPDCTDHNCPGRWMTPEEAEAGSEWWDRPAELAMLIVIAVFVWGLFATLTT